MAGWKSRKAFRRRKTNLGRSKHRRALPLNSLSSLRLRKSLGCALSAILLCAPWLIAHGAELAPLPRLSRTNLLVYHHSTDVALTVKNKSDWLKRRAEIL